ncbi:translation initiation factor IF-2-like [Lutra lutra]|uniref:translation initiation factor IF-2-like n=1 Tax=Lutra lutra TaxID=9657 RepID=UPI001FD25C79|nr:translation initiation factor IF-2-like [Lutra lutra]
MPAAPPRCFSQSGTARLPDRPRVRTCAGAVVLGASDRSLRWRRRTGPLGPALPRRPRAAACALCSPQTPPSWDPARAPPASPLQRRPPAGRLVEVRALRRGPAAPPACLPGFAPAPAPRSSGKGRLPFLESPLLSPLRRVRGCGSFGTISLNSGARGVAVSCSPESSRMSRRGRHRRPETVASPCSWRWPRGRVPGHAPPPRPEPLVTPSQVWARRWSSVALSAYTRVRGRLLLRAAGHLDLARAAGSCHPARPPRVAAPGCGAGGRHWEETGRPPTLS